MQRSHSSQTEQTTGFIDFVSQLFSCCLCFNYNSKPVEVEKEQLVAELEEYRDNLTNVIADAKKDLCEEDLQSAAAFLAELEEEDKKRKSGISN